ncbi:uncharacterized protein LOC130674209 [Microplitis mediator]|uniref:uncharacterized protein LOC130674209 n=1 Tax=Microplitis mediator TaxID=375433 RepID=UPI0025526FE2|nr:uncharacterized protein LOC130674209 [Microplitis mediator]
MFRVKIEDVECQDDTDIRQDVEEALGELEVKEELLEQSPSTRVQDEQARHPGVPTSPELLEWANSSPPRALDCLEITDYGHHSGSTVTVHHTPLESTSESEGEDDIPVETPVPEVFEASPQQEVVVPVVLPLSGVTIYPGNRGLLQISFRVTFLEGHGFLIPFSDPLITVLSPMTTDEGRWVTEHTPWRFMDQFRHDTVLSLMINLCPAHFQERMSTASARVGLLLDELRDVACFLRPPCVYCGQGLL